MRMYAPPFAAIVLVMMPLHAPALDSTTGGDVLVTELLHYLGLPASSRRDVLEKCRVLHTGLADEESLSEEVAAAGAMLLVGGTDPAAVLDAFLHTETFRAVHGASRAAAAAGQTAAAAAHVQRLPAAMVENIARQPQRFLNVSPDEAEKLRAAGRGNDRAGLAAAFESMVRLRKDSFASRGLDGIPAYARPDGRQVAPGRELAVAIRSLALLADDYPGFVESLGGIRTGAGFERGLLEIEVPFESTRVFALSSETRRRFQDRAAGADLHFYASQGYNSMLTVIAVAPYRGQWLAFAINHTFTDAVLGFGSSMKRSIARRRVGETLASHLEAARARLPGTSACRPN